MSVCFDVRMHIFRVVGYEPAGSADMNCVSCIVSSVTVDVFIRCAVTSKVNVFCIFVFSCAGKLQACFSMYCWRQIEASVTAELVFQRECKSYC